MERRRKREKKDARHLSHITSSRVRVKTRLQKEEEKALREKGQWDNLRYVNLARNKVS